MGRDEEAQRSGLGKEAVWVDRRSDGIHLYQVSNATGMALARRDQPLRP